MSGARFDNLEAFVDGTKGQLTIGKIPPIPCAALAAVGKTVRVALVRRPKETVTELLNRFDAALGKVLADGQPIDEVLPEIKRLQGRA